MAQALQKEMLSLFDYVYERASARLDGLTDDEYFWEPVSGCWTVRSTALDGEGESIESPPVTTMGWRLCHVSDAIARHPMNGFLQHGFAPSERQFPMSATAGVEYFRSSCGEWRRLLQGVHDDTWLAPLGDLAGPYAEETALGLALHAADEFVHHTAEIALLRDLYREEATT